jgi:PKD repeat protein
MSLLKRLNKCLYQNLPRKKVLWLVTHTRRKKRSPSPIGRTRPTTAEHTCNLPPTASFTYSPTSGDTCTTFTFNASGSSDPEDPQSALRIRWDFDNNGFYETDWSTTKTITRLLGSPTLHTVRMQVIDTSDRADAVTQTISLSGAVCHGYQTRYLPLVFN